MCAPWDAPLSGAVREEGGKAMAIGVHNGYDLTTKEGFRRAAELVRKARPRYLHISPPCGPWSPLRNLVSRHQNQEQQRIQLGREQLHSRKLLKHCRKLCEIQRKELNGAAGGSLLGEEDRHHAGGEQPLRARSWQLSEFRDMDHMCGGERFSVDGCMHGLRNGKTGDLIRKPWEWFSSLPAIRTALERQCAHGPCAHENIRGPQAAPTAGYPMLLCRRFAKALMEEVLRYPKGGESCPEPQIFSASDIYDEELADLLPSLASLVK